MAQCQFIKKQELKGFKINKSEGPEFAAKIKTIKIEIMIEKFNRCI